MKYPTLRFCLLSCLLVCTVILKFYGFRDAQAGDAGSPRYVHTLTGNIKIHTDFRSQFLPTPRDLIVYLPPDYDLETSRRYPVLYMQDGEIIFDAATSFFAGKERHMDERAQALIKEQQIEPLIIVGIYSGGLARKVEFTQPTSMRPGNADLYGRMLVEEIMPFIQKHYRIAPGSAATGLGGMSLGGSVTLYLGLKYQHIFGKLAITSPAAFPDDDRILRDVKSLRAKTNQRICLSAGSEELPIFLNSARDIHTALISKGWHEGRDLSYLEAAGSQHSPDQRALRVDHFLKFLFPLTVKSQKRG
jgi:predicted alpha/beta superfamily hydrolase